MTTETTSTEPAQQTAKTPNRTKAGLDQARQTAGRVIAASRAKGEAVIEDTREKSFRAAAETNRLFQEHPVAAVAAAAAAGAILAIFLPQLAVASKAGAAAGKAGGIARRALQSSAAREAGQMVLASLGRAERTAVGTAVGKAALDMGRKARKRITPKNTDDE